MQYFAVFNVTICVMRNTLKFSFQFGFVCRSEVLSVFFIMSPCTDIHFVYRAKFQLRAKFVVVLLITITVVVANKGEFDTKKIKTMSSLVCTITKCLLFRRQKLFRLVF